MTEPMTDSQFAKLCAEHDDLRFETTADGQLLSFAPEHSIQGVVHSEVNWQLRGWAKRDGRGIAFDSSTGYVLPNGARRSPDASWTLRSRAAQLSPESQATYWRLCPDFVIELKSNSDRLSAFCQKVLRQKMDEYLANGASLGWILDPATRSVEIYRPGRPVEILIAPDHVLGEGLVDGFVLNLAEVWNPLS
jgi:Uma2 family endonuclease